jgi:pyridoxine 4-dehydrogenase
MVATRVWQTPAVAGETGGAAAAGTWLLGDLRVNRIGFGAMRLPQRGAAFAPEAIPGDRDQAITVLRAAVELGVNHIDTAGFYFSSLRSANELINTALAPYPDDLVIATKVGPRRDPSGGWLPQATPAQLRGQVEENLRQLGRDYLDLVNLRLSGLDSIAGHFGALAELRDADLIRHLGVSNARPEHLAQARQIAPVVCVQNSYGLGHRPGQDQFLRACGESKALVPACVAALPVRARSCPRINTGEVLETGDMLDVCRALRRWTRSTGRWPNSRSPTRAS